MSEEALKEEKNKNVTKRIKGFKLLIISLILVIGSAFYAGWAKQSTYQQSKIIGAELSSVKSNIKSIEEGKKEGNLENLKKTSESLSKEKLNLERPYSFALTVLFLSIALLIKGLYNAFVGVHPSQALDTKRLAMAGFMAALC